MTPPCTRVEETVLDLIKVARTPDEAYDWICRALGQRRTTAERIRAALQARERFPLRTEIETALNDAGEGMLSWLERRYVRGVERSHGLPTASRQARVRHEGSNRYLDNLYEAYRLCVELDGAVAHPAESRWADNRRDRANLAAAQTATMRVGFLDLVDQAHQCQTAAEIAAVLSGRGPGVGHPCRGAGRAWSACRRSGSSGTGLARMGSYNLVMADDASAQVREDQRATHEDRDRVVEVLRLAAGDGRLTVEELAERVGAALTARTYGELTALVSDLPAARDTPAGPPGAPGPKDLVRIECHHSGARRDGQWLVPRRMQIQVTIGNVLLDFTQAILSWPALQIDVQIHSGTLTLVTRPGIMVDTDDLEILQASTVKVLAPWDPDVPVRFRIDVAGTLDVSSITARPPRRTLSQRLRRRPLLQARSTI